jgi:hypothetical protein
MQRVLTIFGVIALAACTAKSSTAPILTEVPGSWAGPISDAILGNGTLSLTLVQSAGDSLAGRWTTTFADSADDLGGSITGDVSGDSLSIVLKPDNPPTCQYGPFHATASLTGTTLMSGTYMTFECTVIDSGTFSAARQ